MTQLNNPVGRLNEILANVLRINEPGPMINGSFDFIKDNDGCSIFRQISMILDLVEESKRMIKSIDHLDQDRYLKPLLTIESRFKSVNLHSSWNDFKQSFDPVTMTQLEYCSDVASKESNESLIESEKIDDLLKDINLLQEKLMEANIGSELTLIIFEQINNIRISLVNYKIFGVNGLKRSLESGIGAVILNREEIKIKSDKKNDDQFKSFFDILSKLNTLVSLGNNTPKLFESASTVIQFLLNQSG
jgi:hypothetical protein